jgi:hypothetical protein
MNKVLTGMQNYQECPIWEDTNEDPQDLGKEMYQVDPAVRRIHHTLRILRPPGDAVGSETNSTRSVNQVVNEMLESRGPGDGCGEKAG